MAHNLDLSNNRANMAYVGKPAWHGLGHELELGASIETWCEVAGLNWEAKRSQVLFETSQGIQKGESNVIYRSDTLKELGVVTERYKIVQPKDVLEFYRDLVSVQGWNLEVAGSLDGGKRVWALAKTDAGFSVHGTQDRVNTYLLLATSFDGTLATVGKFTSVRVVCQNTLTLSLNDNSLAKVSVPHSANFNPERVKESLGIYETATETFKGKANLLANRKVSDSEALTFIKNVIAGKDAKVDELSTRTANTIKMIFKGFSGSGMGASMSTAEGTLWGAVNAITEYTNHQYGNTSNNRLRSVWFGQNDKLNQDALDLALEMI